MADPTTPTTPKKGPNVWYKQQELILKKWGEIGSSYRYLHDRAYTVYNRKNMTFALPVILISTITGTANFAQGTFPENAQPYVPLVIGMLNLGAGLITTIAQFLRVSELLEGHRAASIAYSKFSRNISVELSLPVKERTCGGRDFINTCRAELDRLIEQSPNIPINLVKEFGMKFQEKAFIKPDILDINAVEIYQEENEEAKKKKAIEREKFEYAEQLREDMRIKQERMKREADTNLKAMMENMNKMQEAREAEFMKRLENKTKVEAIDKELEAKDDVTVDVKQVTIDDKPST